MAISDFHDLDDLTSDRNLELNLQSKYKTQEDFVFTVFSFRGSLFDYCLAAWQSSLGITMLFLKKSYGWIECNPQGDIFFSVSLDSGIGKLLVEIGSEWNLQPSGGTTSGEDSARVAVKWITSSDIRASNEDPEQTFATNDHTPLSSNFALWNSKPFRDLSNGESPFHSFGRLKVRWIV